MLPKCSVIKNVHRNIIDYNAIRVYFAVLTPGTLYIHPRTRKVAGFEQYSARKNREKHHGRVIIKGTSKHILNHTKWI